MNVSMLGNLKKNFYMNIGVSALVLLIIIGAIVLLSFDIKSNSRYISETKATLAQRSNSVSDLAALKRASKEADELMSRGSQLLLGKDQIFLFGGELTEVAKKYDLTGFDFGFSGTSVVDGGVKNNPFLIRAEGSYANIIRFVSGLESLQYLINLASINIIGQVGSKYEVKIEGSVFSKE